MTGWRRIKARVERRLDVICGFTRCRSPRDIPGSFLLRVGDGSDGLVKFEVGTPGWLIYASWGVFPKGDINVPAITEPVE